MVFPLHPWHLVEQISCDKDTPDQKGTHKMGTAHSLSNYDQIGDEDRADGRKINDGTDGRGIQMVAHLDKELRRVLQLTPRHLLFLLSIFVKL